MEADNIFKKKHIYKEEVINISSTARKRKNSYQAKYKNKSKNEI